MKLILENPYRIVGLLVGATAREQERQIKRLKQLIEAEQEPKDDFSFPILGDLERTFDSVTDAASKLNLDNDKMNAALFWFYLGNEITDEAAFEALKTGDIDTAIEIWKKLVYSSDNESYNEVNKKNASAFNNLSTFYLQQYEIDEETLELKLRFLESNFYNDLKNKATDETYKISKKELQLLFLNNLTQEEGFDTSRFIDTISDIEFFAKEDFLTGFIQKPIELIEKKIEESKKNRKANKSQSIKGANILTAETKDLIKQVKSILSPTNIKYGNISDKLAMEYFACGRDYFMHYKDTNTDPSDATMKLFKIAKSLAIGNIAKQQIDENIKDLQEWINEKPERDKQKRIELDLNFISDKLEKFQSLSDNIINAKNLVESCKPKLINIKNELGAYDDFYLKISSAIANNALGMLITTVNEAQNSVSVKLGDFSNLRSIINSALEVSNEIGTLDMLPNQKTHYSNNHSTLKSIASQLNPLKPLYQSILNEASSNSRPLSNPVHSIPPPKSSNGCYIATMVYGDYDHPQVIILRQFRDEVLEKSALGKWFIKTYYHYSPKLVERIKNKRTLNSIIRKALNQFIKFIK